MYMLQYTEKSSTGTKVLHYRHPPNPLHSGARLIFTLIYTQVKHEVKQKTPKFKKNISRKTSYTSYTPRATRATMSAEAAAKTQEQCEAQEATAKRIAQELLRTEEAQKIKVCACVFLSSLLCRQLVQSCRCASVNACSLASGGTRVLAFLYVRSVRLSKSPDFSGLDRQRRKGEINKSKKRNHQTLRLLLRTTWALGLSLLLQSRKRLNVSQMAPPQRRCRCLACRWLSLLAPLSFRHGHRP